VVDDALKRYDLDPGRFDLVELNGELKQNRYKLTLLRNKAEKQGRLKTYTQSPEAVSLGYKFQCVKQLIAFAKAGRIAVAQFWWLRERGKGLRGVSDEQLAAILRIEVPKYGDGEEYRKFLSACRDLDALERIQ
jgi:hypothetical protein